jgi:hypothetical protein
VATTETAGFISAADKIRLDSFDTSQFIKKTGGEVSGTLLWNQSEGDAIRINGDACSIAAATGSISTKGSLVLSSLDTGVLHADSSGLITSSSIVDSDIDVASITAIGANSAYAATASNTFGRIVQRDMAGSFSATSMTGNVIGAASNNVLKSGDTMTGALVMADQNRINFRELSVNGSEYVALRAPASIATSIILTLPNGQGNAENVLANDGSGNLHWVENKNTLAQYGVHAYVGTDYTVQASGEAVVIPFSTISFDQHGDFNGTTYTYQAPYSGTYLLSTVCSLDSGNQFDRTLRLVRNGNLLPGYGAWIRNPDTSLCLTTIVSLAQGDLLQVVYIGRQADKILANYTMFDIQLLTKN